MNFKTEPVIGNWYQTEDGQNFEVVAIDPDEGAIEIQYFDGAIEEFDFNSWAQVTLLPISPPEDWSGPMDMMREDYLTDVGMTAQEDWASPLDVLDAMPADEY